VRRVLAHTCARTVRPTAGLASKTAVCRTCTVSDTASGPASEEAWRRMLTGMLTPSPSLAILASTRRRNCPRCSPAEILLRMGTPTCGRLGDNGGARVCKLWAGSLATRPCAQYPLQGGHPQRTPHVSHSAKANVMRPRPVQLQAMGSAGSHCCQHNVGNGTTSKFHCS
jgi:hypothetical protein